MTEFVTAIRVYRKISNHWFLKMMINCQMITSRQTGVTSLGNFTIHS
jgi:hypothetical protein